MAGIVGPLFTGWALTTLGPRIAFDATAMVLMVAALPILGTPNVPVAKAASGSFRAAIPDVLMFTADGWITASYVFVWQIALFLSLGESFTAYGGAMALAALVGAASGFLLGRLIDAGHSGRAVWLTSGSLVVVISLRAASYGNPLLAVMANAAGALVSAPYLSRPRGQPARCVSTSPPRAAGTWARRADIRPIGLRWVADPQLQDIIKLDHAQLQTVMFLQLAVGGHLLLFVVRTKRSVFEPPHPSARLFWAIVATQIVAVAICVLGVGVRAIQPPAIVAVWVYCMVA